MSDAYYRLIFFVGGLIFFILLEGFVQENPRQLKRSDRWVANISIIFLGSLVIKFFAPIALIGLSVWREKLDWGFLNLFELHLLINIFITIIILDFAIYFQHVLTHKIPLFWKFHRVHHTDIDLDVTTALRFHPIEIFASFIYKTIWTVIKHNSGLHYTKVDDEFCKANEISPDRDMFAYCWISYQSQLK